jgi:hypothetical protein
LVVLCFISPFDKGHFGLALGEEKRVEVTDSVSGVTLYLPAGWKAQQPLAEDDTQMRRLFFSYTRWDKPDNYRGVILAHTKAEGITIENFRDIILDSFPNDWKVITERRVRLGTKRIKSLLVRLGFNKGEVDWLMDIYFFRNGNSYMYLQFFMTPASNYRRVRRIFQRIVKEVRLHW